MANKEIWKKVPGFKKYEVSNFGRLRRNWSGRYKILKPYVSNGYHRYSLRNCGALRYVDIHRLVAALFIGRCPKNQVVRHLDGNGTNNYASNLSYGTAKENVADNIRLGVWPHGEKIGLSKLTDKDVVLIRSLYKKNVRGRSGKSLASRFNITSANLSAVVNRKTWRHIP